MAGRGEVGLYYVGLVDLFNATDLYLNDKQ